MLFKVLLTVALVGSTTAAEEADVCKRDLSVAKDGFGKAIESCALAPLMGSIIHMTSECAAYFTAATLAKDDEGNFLSPADIDRGVLCPCVMQPTKGELKDGEVQDPNIAKAVENIGECNAADAVDKGSTNVFNLGAEAKWCVSCWAPVNKWDSDTSPDMYVNVRKQMAGEKKVKDAAKMTKDAKTAGMTVEAYELKLDNEGAKLAKQTLAVFQRERADAEYVVSWALPEHLKKMTDLKKMCKALYTKSRRGAGDAHDHDHDDDKNACADLAVEFAAVPATLCDTVATAGTRDRRDAPSSGSGSSSAEPIPINVNPSERQTVAQQVTAALCDAIKSTEVELNEAKAAGIVLVQDAGDTGSSAVQLISSLAGLSVIALMM